MVTSDDEGEEYVAPTDWTVFTLRFGKHANASLSDLLQTPKKRSYLRYLLTWDLLRPTSRNMIEQALAAYEDFKKQNKK